MKLHKLVCITGMPGAGKSIVSDFFVSQGYQFLRFGQIVLDEVIKLGLEVNEKNERMVREKIRERYGEAAMVLLNFKKIEEMMQKGSVIGDGLYSFAEYKLLKKHFPKELVVIAVFAPPQLRYARISQRQNTPEDTGLRNHEFTIAEAKERDMAELNNLNKGATIAMADYTIINTRDKNYLLDQVSEIIKEINKI